MGYYDDLDALGCCPDTEEVVEVYADDPTLFSRRDALKIGAGTVGMVGAARVAPEFSPVGRARAVGPIAIGAGVAGGIALGYLVKAVKDHYFGEDRYDELTGTEETNDLHAELRTRLLEGYAANGIVLSVVNNRLADAGMVAWPSAKKEVLEVFNAGGTELDAEAAGHAAIDKHYSIIQENLATRFEQWILTLKNVFDLEQADPDLTGIIDINVTGHVSGSESYDAIHSPEAGYATALDDYSITLLDGRVITSKSWRTWNTGAATAGGDILMEWYPDGNLYYWNATSSGTSSDPLAWGEITGSVIDPVPDTTGAAEEFIHYQDWGDAYTETTAAYVGLDLWSEAVDAAAQMRSNVDLYATNLYQNYESGAFSTTGFYDPVTLAGELATDYATTGYHVYAAAEVALLGIPGDVDHALKVELIDSAITLDATLWTEWEPEGVDTPFNVGTIYDPTTNGGIPVFVSFEYGGPEYIDADSGVDVWNLDADGAYVQEAVTTQAEYDAVYVSGETIQTSFMEVEEPFKITEATNLSTGESVTTVGLESKNYQTGDVSLTEEQFKQLLDLRTTIRENESPGGGGGAAFNFDSFALGDIPGVATVAAIGLGAVYLMTRGGGGRR